MYILEYAHIHIYLVLTQVLYVNLYRIQRNW